MVIWINLWKLRRKIINQRMVIWILLVIIVKEWDYEMPFRRKTRSFSKRNPPVHWSSPLYSLSLHLLLFRYFPNRWTLIDTHPPYGDFMVCRRKTRFLRQLRECVADRLTSKNLFGQFGHDSLLIIRVQRERGRAIFICSRVDASRPIWCAVIKHPERFAGRQKQPRGSWSPSPPPVSPPLYSVFTPHCPLGNEGQWWLRLNPNNNNHYVGYQ